MFDIMQSWVAISWQLLHVKGMTKHIIGLAVADNGLGLWPTYLHFFFEVHSTFDKAYSAIYDQLHFRFDLWSCIDIEYQTSK